VPGARPVQDRLRNAPLEQEITMYNAIATIANRGTTGTYEFAGVPEQVP
jgi:hypothetical protein